jgi:ammonia channel protein AmtB
MMRFFFDRDVFDLAGNSISTVLVLGMSPALAFFEAGMLRSKHTLSIISQVFLPLHLHSPQVFTHPRHFFQ